MCPGNRVIFTCQLTGVLTRWTINLPSGTLQTTVQSTEAVGTIFTFENDPFHFEVHVVSNSMIRTTELQVTAVRQLDGVTVECDGQSGDYMSTIRVASVGELINIMPLMHISFTSIKLKTLQLLQVES